MNSPEASSALLEARRWLARLRTYAAAEVARSGRLDDAATYLAPAGAAAEDDDVTLDLLARIRAQQGRLEEAGALWDAVLARDPANASARAALARIDALRPGARRATPRPTPRSGPVPAGRSTLATTAPAAPSAAVVTTTVAGVIVAWDDGAVLLFGRAADHALGSPVSALFSGGSKRLDERNLADLRGGEPALDCVAKFSSPSGSPRHGSYDMEPILDPAGRLVAIRRTIRVE